MSDAFENEFRGKRIAVLGMARSGLAAAEVLMLLGAHVRLYDSKPANEMQEAVLWAKNRHLPAHTGVTVLGKADIVVTSPGVRVDSPILLDAAQRGMSIWGEVEAAYHVADAPILAVTGTNGKTTTALLLADMLRAGGVETFAAGNIAAGDLAMPLIRAAYSAPATAAIVAEISSFQLETIDQFRPRVAAVLNLTPDHQDRQDWDSYVASKWRLFENLGDGDDAILPSDLPSPEPRPEIRGRITFYDQVEAPEWIDKISIPGRHNQMNVRAAVCMARAYGVSEDAIKQAALAFRGVVHRLEYVATVGNVQYVNNSMCTNNAAFAGSLQAIGGPKVLLTGGVYKGGDPTPLAAAVRENDVRLLVLFGKSGPALEQTMRDNGVESVVCVEALGDAMRVAEQSAYPGDTVLLNPGCASFDQFRDFEDRGETFRTLVHALRDKRADR